ncbi:MAG: hypothetical protein LBE27_07330, partial [Deltaproteobacteria bacterium]|nr:hypothetical protein [Deltaproteobacteria bacterium]
MISLVSLSLRLNFTKREIRQLFFALFISLIVILSSNTQLMAQNAKDSPSKAQVNGKGGKSGSQEVIPTAAEHIERRLAEFDKNIYVYRDYEDGANYFTQRAFMGESYLPIRIPPIKDDAEGRNGTTGILCEINFTNQDFGGYMLQNGVLLPGETIPQNNMGTFDAGYDLRGAKKLTFWAKGEKGGERIDFFVGGLGINQRSTERYPDSDKIPTGYMKLSDKWEKYEIDLSYANLSRIGNGFAWTTNHWVNNNSDIVRFHLDDIRFEFERPVLRPLFLASYSPEKPGTPHAITNNFSFLYDQSLAILALSYAGKHERARQIADAILYAIYHDRFYTDGRLRNAYMNGSPMSSPGWFNAKGEAFARLPSFWNNLESRSVEDIYTVGTTAGNCAWAIIALLVAHDNSPEDSKYLDAARKIGEFVLTLDTGKGFTAGYDGWEPNPKKLTYLSTEHNADLVVSYGKLAKLTGEEKYKKAAESAKAFVLAMYDPKKGAFYTGTGADGVTINKEVIPLDCQTW